MDSDNRTEKLIQDMMGFIDIEIGKIYPMLSEANPCTWIDEGRYDSLAECIRYMREYMLSNMKDSSDSANLDSHKLASAAVLSILSTKIFMLSDDKNKLSEFPFANEIFALDVSMNIVVNFQVFRVCKKLGVNEYFDDIVKTFYERYAKYHFPGLINDIDAIESNLTLAFQHFFHIGGRESFKASAWIFSDIFYFIDSTTIAHIESIIDEILNDMGISTIIEPKESLEEPEHSAIV